MKKLSEMELNELWQLFPIILKPYNEKYVEQYNEEEANLSLLLGTNKIKRISHIGSTALPTIISKPIVDILLEIDGNSDLKEIDAKLTNAGWIKMAENFNPLRISYNKGYTDNGYADKVFHLHLKEYGNCDELYFRDYLISHTELAKKYERLKQELYIKCRPNRDAYTKGKTDFVEKIVALAKEEFNYKYNEKK